jgi:hypothetical protein
MKLPGMELHEVRDLIFLSFPLALILFSQSSDLGSSVAKKKIGYPTTGC